MRRWWPVISLLIVVLTVLAVPEARDFARFTAEPWPDTQAYSYYYLDVTDRSSDDLTQENIARHARIRSRFPEDRQARFSCAAVGMPDRVEKELDKLAPEFPGDVLFLATRLENLAARSVDNREQGPFTKTTINSEPPKPYKPLTAEQTRLVRKMLQLAREGQRLESDNQLFDWYEMYALFALRRDAEVLPVLQRAASKKRYNDYFLEWVRTEYAVRQHERLLAPEETIGLWQNVSLAHRYKWRQVARLLMEKVVAARHRGDQKLPLEISHALLRLGRTIRLQDKTAYGSMSGLALESFGLTLWRENWSTKVFNPKIPGSMVDFAVAVGNRPLAHEAMNEKSVISAWRAGYRRASTVTSAVVWSQWSDQVPRSLIVLKVLEKAGYFLGWAALYLVPLWLLLLFLARRNRAAIEGEARVMARAGFLGGVIGFVSLAALLGADAAFLHQTSVARYLMDGVTYMSLPGLMLAAPCWIVSFPMIGLVSWPLFLVTRWQKRMAPPRKSWAEAMVTAGAAEGVVNVVVGYAFPIIAVASCTILGLGALGWYCWTTRAEDVQLAAPGIAGAVALGLAVPFLWVWKSRPRRRQGLVLWLRATRSAIAGYLVTMGICYGLALLAASPALRDYRGQFEALMRQGDLVLFRGAGKF